MSEQEAGAARRTPPVDPRLLKHASASRGFFALIAAISVGQTAAIVAFAWLLTRAIVGAIDGMPSSDLAATLGLLALVVGARAALLWATITCGVVAAVALIASVLANMRKREGWAFTAGAVTIIFAVLTLWTALFPFVMPSSTDAANSLTIENASSTDYTLTIMSWAALVFLPLVLAYQAWTYWIFRKRVSRTRIERAVAAAAH